VPGRRAAAPGAPLLLLLLLAPAAARAQTRTACDGQVIRTITVQPAGLFTDESDKRAATLLFQGLGRALSWQTREATVRRELRFAEGEPCDRRRLVETARVLRDQAYLRSAELIATPVPGDSVDIEVRTEDELALDANARLDLGDNRTLKSARLNEDNLLGRGVLAQLRYDYLGRRAGMVVDVLHRQVMGRNDAELAIGRTSIGPVGEVAVRRMFESEYDRTAFRFDVRWREEPFAMRADSFGTVSQPVVSTGVDLGLARRNGPPGRQTQIGASVSFERQYTTGVPQASLPSDDSAAAAQLTGRYHERRRLSTDLLIGYRDVHFVPRRGLDAVNALQDAREGFEVRLIGGHGWDAGGGLQDDWSALLDLYAAAEVAPHTMMFTRARAEGRYLAGGWDGVIAAADLFGYTSFSRRTSVAYNVRAAGGWNTSTPFQLEVSGPLGMRGYGLNALPAGRRVVAQAEHRYLVGTVFRAADLGTALFVDVGRGWAGDAAFGVNTGLMVAAGAGLRTGFPSGSRVTTQLDLAVPLRNGHGWELRLTLRRRLGISGPEADDVERSRLPVSTLQPFQFTRY
jgi:hypothetical protein